MDDPRLHQQHTATLQLTSEIYSLIPSPIFPPLFTLENIKLIHYAYPPLLLLYLLVTLAASAIKASRSEDGNLGSYVSSTRRLVLLWLVVGVLVSYVAEAVSILVHALTQAGWWADEDRNVYIIASIMAWTVLELSLLDDTEPIWYPYWGSWLIGLFCELTLIIFYGHFSKNESGSIFYKIELGLKIGRILSLFLLVFLYWAFRGKNPPMLDGPNESSALLAGQANSTTEYGTASDDTCEWERGREEVRHRMTKRREEAGSWWRYASAYLVFWKYIWPHNDRSIQLRILAVGGCLLVERGLNVLVPMQMGRVTEALVNNGLNSSHPWKEVSLFVLFRWLASGSGLGALHRFLWIAVDQYTYRSLSSAAYNHVMSLSFDFHSNVSKGELYSSVHRGRSINGFIDLLLFSVFPMFTDFVVAFTYFYFMFGTYMALIVTFVSITYVWVTAKLSRKRERIRRKYNKTAEKEYTITLQSLEHWMTVSYFNRIPYEEQRYTEAIRGHQAAELEWTLNISILSVTQNLVFTIGLLFASFLAVYKVTLGQRKVGDFVTLLSYWAQLSGPLAFFTSLARRIQDQMLDAERLLELLVMRPTVTDKHDAKKLVATTGDVVMEDVVFSYDARKTVLKGVSFNGTGGKTIAFVGETGGGKTTCLNLLFRFHDVTSGSIKIDGQDIRDVTLSSLRSIFGIVPQETELFNESIMDNLRYARFDATDEQVYDACRAAAVHDKIMAFPDGYLSKVGERGIRLSGGEKQRISIARAILKDPKIVLLDEATSAVDIKTEKLIQEALRRLAQGRTMFVIAHRLTTIMNADMIMVLKDGNICERGTHSELLRQKGVYYSYWTGDSKDGGIEINGADKVAPMDLLLQNQNSEGSEPLHIKFTNEGYNNGKNFRPHTFPSRPFLLPPGVTRQNQPKNVAPKPPVQKTPTLKPDAKEFVPTSFQKFLVDDKKNVGDVNPPVEIPKKAEEQPTEAKESEDTELLICLNGGENNPKSVVTEVTGDETDPKKKRRRNRRRSRSSRNSSGGDPSSPIDSVNNTNGFLINGLQKGQQKRSGGKACTDSYGGQDSGMTRPTANENGVVPPQNKAIEIKPAGMTEAIIGSLSSNNGVITSYTTTKHGLGEVYANAKDRSGGSQRKGPPYKRRNTGVENTKKSGILGKSS